MAVAYSVACFISNSLLLQLVVGQVVKKHPPPTESVSAHLCWAAIEKFWNCGAKAMKEVK